MDEETTPVEPTIGNGVVSNGIGIQKGVGGNDGGGDDAPIEIHNGMKDDEVIGISSGVAPPPSEPIVETFPGYLYPILDEIANSEGISNYTIEVELNPAKGDGFVGIIFIVTIIGTRPCPEGTKQEQFTLSLIVKVPPTSQIRRIQYGAMRLFQREVIMYNDILPEFIQFQEENGINSELGFFGIPKCYYANFDAEKDEAAIIMEDLRAKGYKSCDKYAIPDYAHVRRLFIELGRFHATSFAIKQKKPELLEKLKKLTDAMSNADGNATNMIKRMTAVNIDRAIETLLPHEEFKKAKLMHLKETIVEVLQDCTNGLLAEPFSVVNHGDCWTNNIMYAYENNIPTKVGLIDWQVSRYASPVLDVVYFMFLCTDKAFRDEHYDTIIQIYYKSLREQLERFNCEIGNFFPLTALLRQLKKYGKFGLCMALFVMPMLVGSDDDIPDMNVVADNFTNDSTDMVTMEDSFERNKEKYVKRMGNVIRDSVRLGYF